MSTQTLSVADRNGSATVVPEARTAADGILAAVLARLDDDKAEDTVTIDLAGKTTIADWMVVSSGRSHRHVGAIADHIVQDLKSRGVAAQVEGVPHCDWVLIDAGDVVVHIFRPEVRAFYNLEKMWSGARPGARARA